jgi:glucose/arabinose dehydrogenase
MRRISVLLAALLVTWFVPPTSVTAAPVRYEAENAPATCDGTIDSNWGGYSGTGFCNANNALGAAAQFTVNAPIAGTATISFRYGHGSGVNRPADIIINGTTVQPNSAFNSTPAWDQWATKTITATVTAGSNTIRLVPTTANGLANFDYVDFEVVPPASFVDYQAENCAVTLGVFENIHAGYTGTGFINGDNAVGSAITCTVSNTGAAGPRSLEVRFANATTTVRPMDLVVNGSTVTNIAFQGTGAWSTWATLTFNVNLNAGSNTIRLVSTTVNGGPNLDRLRVAAPSDTQAPTTPGLPVCTSIVQDSITLAWPGSTDNVGVVAYDIYHDGTLLASPSASPHTLSDLNFNFTYRFSVFARDAAGNTSTTSPLATCQTGPSSDTTAPSAPSNFVHSAVTQTGASLSWTGSTDNVGVRAYLVRDANNVALLTLPGNPPVTSVAMTGLACNTAYTLHVVARDKAGNLSAASNTRSFTTGACSRGVPQTPTIIGPSNWDVPWDICWEPGGTFALITERDTFRVFKLLPNGTKTQVGTVPNSVTTDGEGGLMGCASSPTWNGTSDTEWFFMHTSNDNGVTENRVVKMTFNSTTLSARTVVLGGIRSSRYHNGGRIKFGPDGYLYVATGDAQQANLAQDPNSLSGKVLRVTKAGAAAPGNPFGTRVYSLGHRNPQALGWDSAGRLWEAEFGNSIVDEVNFVEPGKNYGWPTCEGNCSVAGMTNPKWQKATSACSCAGFAIVNDTIYLGALRGQRLWRLELTGTNVTAESQYFTSFGRIRAVTKRPGQNVIWFSSSNSDNNGNGSLDIIRQSVIQ